MSGAAYTLNADGTFKKYRIRPAGALTDYAPPRFTTRPTTPRLSPGRVTARGNSSNSRAAEFGNSALGMRSLLVGWNELQPARDAEATNTEWTTLNASIAHAHSAGFSILLRILGGTEHTPLWVYTNAGSGNNPVPWVPSGQAASVTTAVGHPFQGPYTFKVNVMPVIMEDFPVPLPWTANASAASQATIEAAVAASPLRAHFNYFLDNMLVPWLNGPCPADSSHTRAAHVRWIPATFPTGHGSEMTTSNNNPVNRVPTYFKTSVASNTGPITGSTNCAIAYRKAWDLAGGDLVAKLPDGTGTSIAGGMLFGDGAAGALWLLQNRGPTWGAKCAWMRTDFRQSYFRAGGHGGGLPGKQTSPINFLKEGERLNLPVGIQVAMETLFFDDGGPENTNTMAGMVEELLSHLPRLQFFEGSTSMTRSGGSTFWSGAVYNTTQKVGSGPFAGVGWPGGPASAAQYLTTAEGNVQSRLGTTA